jgi:hypothetical protein
MRLRLRARQVSAQVLVRRGEHPSEAVDRANVTLARIHDAKCARLKVVLIFEPDLREPYTARAFGVPKTASRRKTP